MLARTSSAPWPWPGRVRPHLKANEAIGQITKAQIETVAAKTQATVEEAADKVAKAAGAKAK